MSKRIVVATWARADVGDVLALVHPGGLLLTPLKVYHVGIESQAHLELRFQVTRYAGKATGGTVATSRPVADDQSNAAADARVGSFAIVGTPELSMPIRCCSRGPRVGIDIVGDGALTVGPNRSLVFRLLDAVPLAPSEPLSFVLVYDE